MKSKTYNTKLTAYRNLIVERDELQRAANSIYLAYIKKFGNANIDLFNLKIECIRLKKTIGEIQRCVNRGNVPDMNIIYTIVDNEMQSYYDNLSAMKNSLKSADDSEKANNLSVSQIKVFYKRMAKMLHPDLHPELENDEKAKELWDEVQKAYYRLDLKRMKEMFVLVTEYVKSEESEEIEDIDDKISDAKSEIEQIRTTNPYLYKFILEDENECFKILESISSETEEYKNYREELKAILDTFNVKGGIVS